MSNKFNLTEKRLSKITKLLMDGYSLKYVAFEIGIKYNSLTKKLKEIDYDWKQYKTLGIDKIRGSLISDIESIDDDYKRVDAKLKFLSKYDNNDNDNDNDAAGSFNANDIRMKILEDLNE